MVWEMLPDEHYQWPLDFLGRPILPRRAGHDEACQRPECRGCSAVVVAYGVNDLGSPLMDEVEADTWADEVVAGFARRFPEMTVYRGAIQRPGT